MSTIRIKAKSYISVIVLLSSAIVAPSSWAHDNCTPYTAVFHLEGSNPFGPLNGGGIYNIGDQAPQQAQVSAVLKGSASFNPAASVMEVKYSDMVLFPPGPDGSLNILTAIDKSIASATGPGTFEATTKSRITGGTGLYEDVTGRAFSTNVTSIDLTTGYTVSDVQVKGIICGIGEANNN